MVAIAAGSWWSASASSPARSSTSTSSRTIRRPASRSTTDAPRRTDGARRRRRRQRRPRPSATDLRQRRHRRAERRRRRPRRHRGRSTGTDSAVGYRVVEVLFGQDTEGVGRTSAITGQLTIAGTQVTAADFEVDMTTVTSDEDRRDNQFHGRLMDTDEFPTATFDADGADRARRDARPTATTITAHGDRRPHAARRPRSRSRSTSRPGRPATRSRSSAAPTSCSPTTASRSPTRPGISTQDHGLLEFDLHFVPA